MSTMMTCIGTVAQQSSHFDCRPTWKQTLWRLPIPIKRKCLSPTCLQDSTSGYSYWRDSEANFIEREYQAGKTDAKVRAAFLVFSGRVMSSDGRMVEIEIALLGLPLLEHKWIVGEMSWLVDQRSMMITWAN